MNIQTGYNKHIAFQFVFNDYNSLVFLVKNLSKNFWEPPLSFESFTFGNSFQRVFCLGWNFPRSIHRHKQVRLPPKLLSTK